MLIVKNFCIYIVIHSKVAILGQAKYKIKPSTLNVTVVTNNESLKIFPIGFFERGNLRSLNSPSYEEGDLIRTVSTQSAIGS